MYNYDFLPFKKQLLSRDKTKMENRWGREEQKIFFPFLKKEMITIAVHKLLLYKLADDKMISVSVYPWI